MILVGFFVLGMHIHHWIHVVKGVVNYAVLCNTGNCNPITPM